MSRPIDDTTKPSRLNRKRKKRWKIADWIEAGLTECWRVAMLFSAGSSSTGRGNPFSTGEKSPQQIAAFLCLSFRAALCRFHSVMAGCFGQRSALAAPVGGFPPHYSPSPDTVESVGDGYSHQLESPL